MEREVEVEGMKVGAGGARIPRHQQLLLPLHSNYFKLFQLPNQPNAHHGSFQEAVCHRHWCISPTADHLHPRKHRRGQPALRRIRDCPAVRRYRHLMESKWPGTAIRQRKGAPGRLQANSRWHSTRFPRMYAHLACFHILNWRLTQASRSPGLRPSPSEPCYQLPPSTRLCS